MHADRQFESGPSPLRIAMDRLTELRNELNSARRDSTQTPVSREEITNRLDDLDDWIEDLIGLLGERRHTPVEASIQKH
ncbi:MAG: hypothetical protein IT336_12510 [Thermomicrobiales bacterium]|nr:hypothetical protein [Thermomicrobiales bacterium]